MDVPAYLTIKFTSIRISYQTIPDISSPVPGKIKDALLQDKSQESKVGVNKLLVRVPSIYKGILIQSTGGSSCDSLLVTVHKAADSQLNDVMIFMQLWQDTLSKKLLVR